MSEKVVVLEKVELRVAETKRLYDPTDPELWFNQELRARAYSTFLATNEALSLGLPEQAEAQLELFAELRDQDVYEGFPTKAEGEVLRVIPLNVRQIKKGEMIDYREATADCWEIEWSEIQIKKVEVQKFLARVYEEKEVTVNRRLYCDRYSLNSREYRAPLQVLQLVPSLRQLVDDSQISVFVENPAYTPRAIYRDPVLAAQVGSGWYLVARWE